MIGYISLDEQIDRALQSERLLASLSLWFGVLATGLGAIGLYGVMAFAVARRTREIGLRIALGADRRAVVQMILRGAAGMAAIGIGLGAALALALGRYVESQLYGIRGADLVTLAGAAGGLVAVVVASGLATGPPCQPRRPDGGASIRVILGPRTLPTHSRAPLHRRTAKPLG